jgi:hypothetical protein
MTRVDGLKLVECGNREGFFVHSIWLNKLNPCQRVPQRFEVFVTSWKKMHPGDHIVHVVWNGNASDAFFNAYFPSKLAFYQSLPTEVQQSDYLRLLLLYQYGGMYADIDQQCNHTFIDSFFKFENEHIILLQSPLFTEEYTNCLMVSLSIRHQFWLDVASTVEQTVTSIRTGRGLSKTCSFYFNMPLIGQQIQVLFTNNITGPSCIDRTIAHFPHYGCDIHPLAPSEFYNGKYSVHHEYAEWFSSHTLQTVKKVGIIFVCISITVFTANFGLWVR